MSSQEVTCSLCGQPKHSGQPCAGAQTRPCTRQHPEASAHCLICVFLDKGEYRMAALFAQIKMEAASVVPQEDLLRKEAAHLREAAYSGDPAAMPRSCPAVETTRTLYLVEHGSEVTVTSKKSIADMLATGLGNCTVRIFETATLSIGDQLLF